MISKKFIVTIMSMLLLSSIFSYGLEADQNTQNSYIDDSLKLTLYQYGRVKVEGDVLNRINMLLGQEQNEIGNFKTIRGFSIDNILKRLSKNSEVRVQYDGRGLVFLDPSIPIAMRIYGPSNAAPLNSEPRGGWVARTQVTHIRARRPETFNYVTNQLVDFASLEYQDCYVTHGNQEAFILLEDIINDYYVSNNKRALENVKRELKISNQEEKILNEFSNFLKNETDGADQPLWKSYYALEHKAISQRQSDQKFSEKMKEFSARLGQGVGDELQPSKIFKNEDERIDFLKNFIFSDPSLQKIRQKAQECLLRLGFDLKKWENKYIDWSQVGLKRPKNYR